MATSFGEVRFEKSRVELGTGGGGSIWLGRINSQLERQAHHEADRMNASGSSRSQPRRRRDVSASVSRSPHTSRDGGSDDEADNAQWTLIAVKRKHIQHASSFPSYQNNATGNSSSRPTTKDSAATGRDGDDASNPSNEEEHQLLASLDPHPNIITLFGWLTNGTSGATCMALELMDSDLAREIRCGNLPSELSIRFITFGVLSALEYLHSRQIVHRDVKPSNLLLKGDLRSSPLGARVVLSDFGSSHYATDARRPAVNVRGTRWYQPPEILLGQFKPGVACACDVWALGCTVFEMFVGRAPFVGDSCLRMLQQVLSVMGCNYALAPVEGQSPKLFEGVEHRISPEAQDLILLMLTTDPTKRPTAETLLHHSFFDPVRDFLCDPTELAATLGPLTARTQFRCAAEFKLRGGKKLDTSGLKFAPVEGATSLAGIVADGSCSPAFNSFCPNDHHSVARSQPHSGMGPLQFSSSRASSCATSYRNVHSSLPLGYSSGGRGGHLAQATRALTFSAQSQRLPLQPLFSNHSPDSSIGDSNAVHSAHTETCSGPHSSFKNYQHSKTNESISRALHGMYDTSHDTSMVNQNQSRPVSAAPSVGGSALCSGLIRDQTYPHSGPTFAKVDTAFQSHSPFQMVVGSGHPNCFSSLLHSSTSTSIGSVGRSAGGQYTALSYGSSRPPTASPLNMSAEVDTVRCGTSAGIASRPGGDFQAAMRVGDHITVPVVSIPPPASVALASPATNRYRNPLASLHSSSDNQPKVLPLPLPSSSYAIRSEAKVAHLPFDTSSPAKEGGGRGILHATINASTTTSGLFTVHNSAANAYFKALVPAPHHQQLTSRGGNTASGGIGKNSINSFADSRHSSSGAVAGIVNTKLFDELLTTTPPKTLSFDVGAEGEATNVAHNTPESKIKPVAVATRPFGTTLAFNLAEDSSVVGADGQAEVYRRWAGEESPNNDNPHLGTTPLQWKTKNKPLQRADTLTEPMGAAQKLDLPHFASNAPDVFLGRLYPK